mgnify:FL=1
MAYTQPVLGSTTLPHPSDYSERRAFRGAMAEMADGLVYFAVVNTNVKRQYTLTWKVVSDASKVLIETAYDALKVTSLSFTPPTGASAATVTRTDKEIEFTVVKAAAGLRWNAVMELREV